MPFKPPLEGLDKASRILDGHQGPSETIHGYGYFWPPVSEVKDWTFNVANNLFRDKFVLKNIGDQIWLKTPKTLGTKHHGNVSKTKETLQILVAKM